MAIATSEVRTGWGLPAEFALRRLAATVAAGAVIGLLVGGVGGRLAMMLLARLNPSATGVTSDDGFRIGQFTLSSTMGLLIVTTAIGVLGGVIYVVVRSLMIGPRWFQVLSISLGPAIVVGSMLVSPDGVDFTLLRPVPLAIALFVAIPGLYAVLLTVLAERWLEPDGWFMRGPRVMVLAPLVLCIPIAPLVAAVAVAWIAERLLLRDPRTRAAVSHPLLPWVARIALAVIFAAGLFNLISDTASLTG
jgi:hypothetical protein